MALTGKTIGQLTYLQFPTNDTLIPVEYVGDTYHITFSSITYTEGTYSQFVSDATNGVLTPGKFYLMTDFQTCYDQPNFDYNGNPITTGNYKSGSTEPLLLMATATDKFSSTVFSPQYPFDKITYNITWDTTEVTGGPAKGRITERIDEFNNRADYDFRSVQFIRYEAFYSESYYDGTLSIDGVGNVVGVNTQFDLDFSVGQIIGVYNPYDAKIGCFMYYEVVSISGSTNMVVTGGTIVEIANTRYSNSNSAGLSNPFQCNILSSSYTGFSEYYTFEGSSFNTYLGNNNSDGTFLLSNNVFLDGDYRDNYFGGSVINNTFDDDMNNNTCGPDFQNNIITNDFDRNSIGQGFRRNIIACDMADNIIGSNFLSNTLGDDDGPDFDSNFIGNNFQRNFITFSDDDFRNNNIGEDFSDNIIDGSFENNRIAGEFFTNLLLNGFDGNDVGNGFTNNFLDISFYRNNIGVNFYSNNLTGGSFNENVIVGSFYNNNIFDSNFTANHIGYNFYGNNIYANFQNNTNTTLFFSNTIYYQFDNNQIGTQFENNVIGDTGTIGGFAFEKNDIGNTFKSNQFGGCDFGGNVVKDEFLANTITADILYNKIGTGFFLNNINGPMRENTIGNQFQFNTVQGTFYYNTIGSYFNDNVIGDGFGFGGGSYRGNVIGNNFYDNTIGEYFYTNRITDNFTNNTVGEFFQNNDITFNGLNGTDFTTYYNGIANTSSAGGLGGSDGTWVGVTQSSTTLNGTGAIFDITTLGGIVTSIVVTTAGKLYQVGEQLTIDGSSIGGSSNLTITVDTLTTTPLVYLTANCTISNSIDNFAVLTAIDWDTVSWVITTDINQ